MRSAGVRKAPIGKFIDERTDRLRDDQATIYSVTNDRGFVPSLELFDKQVFSADTGSYKKVGHQDIAFNPSRINVGSIALLDDGAGGAVSPMYTVVRCKPGLRPAYLLNFLRSEIGQMEIRRRCEGAVRFMLKYNDLCRIEIPLPAPEEQDRLVALLDDADALRKLRVRAEARTAQLIPAIFQEMFGDAISIPRQRIADLVPSGPNRIRTGPFGSDLLHSEFVEEGVPVLGIDNVVANHFRWAKERYINHEKYSGLSRYQVFPGDVLITIMGTVGRCAVVPQDVPECINTKHLCAITPDPERLDPYYLWGAILYSPEVKRQTQVVGQGAIMEGWNGTIIKNLQVPVPALSLQHEFATRVTEVRGLQAAQGQARIKVEALWGSLLGEVFG